MIMAGMSAAFSALFGTPMAATVFSMEVVSVGIMHYAALVPCVVASYIAYGVACHFGLTGERFSLGTLPEFNLPNAGKILFLGFCCAAVSILFCVVLHKTEEIFAEKIKNAFVRPLVSGVLIIILTMLLGTTDYLGTGMQVVERAVVDQQVVWCAFLLKIVFTAITLSGRLQGRRDRPHLLCRSYLRLPHGSDPAHLPIPGRRLRHGRSILRRHQQPYLLAADQP